VGARGLSVRNRGQVMPDAAAGTLAVPIWLAGAAAAVLVVAILLAVKRAGGVALIASLFRVGLIAAAVLGAWLYVQQRGVSAQDPTPGSERRALDDRKAALMAGSIAPGSALSCLDELAGEAVEAACEKAVFASPEAVASAVKYVTAQLALLNDGTTYVARGDAAYAAELAPLRTAIELDRFGLVAHVLGDREGARRSNAMRCRGFAIPPGSNQWSKRITSGSRTLGTPLPQNLSIQSAMEAVLVSRQSATGRPPNPFNKLQPLSTKHNKRRVALTSTANSPDFYFSGENAVSRIRVRITNVITAAATT
jgi:hypothetical protein